ncbi:class I SAM-dependent methyltransferase [Cumulibacter manganitolerans]|uniref:class I SAM-dependent methyltransferase n=1 Tax=Cumulibacter manganitolerans TaxID=1884992 RepID=UPI0012959D7D|nr:class I SAM-dependent methyltransferase [Cumulibacter manganitolerans]
MTAPRSRFDITRPAGERLEAYVAKFTAKYEAGADVAGEARFIDALADRGSAILDGGCGTGRTGAALTQAGHRVLGVDRSPRLVEVARQYFPHARYAVRDLLEVSSVDLVDAGLPPRADVIVLAGNVMPCLAGGTERQVLENLRSLLAVGGRLVLGFRTDREYTVADLHRHQKELGLRELHRFSDWQLGSWREDAAWIVSVMTYEGTE